MPNKPLKYTFATLCMFVVLILSATVLRAQTRDLAALEGHVLDEQGKAIAGAQVKLTDTDTGAERAAQSDAQGKYDFAGQAGKSIRGLISGWQRHLLLPERERNTTSEAWCCFSSP